MTFFGTQISYALIYLCCQIIENIGNQIKKKNTLWECWKPDLINIQLLASFVHPAFDIRFADTRAPLESLCVRSKTQRNLKYKGLSMRVLVLILNAFSMLTPNCATWHPLNKTLTNHLESVQRFACRVYCSPGTWNMMTFFPAHPFPPSKLAVAAQLWVMSSKFLPVYFLLPMSLFLTLAPVQDVTIPMCSTSFLVMHLTLCQRSFFHLGPKLWNKLSENVASCVTLPAFKAAVRDIIMD